MAICTLQGHVSRAIDFYNKDSMFFAIGKSTPWQASDIEEYDSSKDYEQNPPAPKNTDTIKETIGYKRVEFKSMVVPDEINGTLEYRGTKWRIVPASDAIKEGARWVFISSELVYDELPTTLPYRQVGVYTGTTLVFGVNTNLYALLPSQVESAGLLEVIDNRKPVYRDTDVKEKLKIILEF